MSCFPPRRFTGEAAVARLALRQQQANDSTAAASNADVNTAALQAPPTSAFTAPESLQSEASIAAAPESTQQQNGFDGEPSTAAAPALVPGQENAPQGYVRPNNFSANPRMASPAVAAPAPQNGPQSFAPIRPNGLGYNPRMAPPAATAPESLQQDAHQGLAATRPYDQSQAPAPQDVSQNFAPIRPNNFAANPRMAPPTVAAAPAFHQNGQGFAPLHPNGVGYNPRAARMPQQVYAPIRPSTAPFANSPAMQPEASVAAPDATTPESTQQQNGFDDEPSTAVPVPGQDEASQGYVPIRPNGVAFADPPSRIPMQPEASVAATASNADALQAPPTSTPPVPESLQFEASVAAAAAPQSTQQQNGFDGEPSTPSLQNIKEKIIQILRYYTGVKNMTSVLATLYHVDIEGLMERFQVTSVEELFKLMDFDVNNKCLVGFENQL